MCFSIRYLFTLDWMELYCGLIYKIFRLVLLPHASNTKQTVKHRSYSSIEYIYLQYDMPEGDSNRFNVLSIYMSLSYSFARTHWKATRYQMVDRTIVKPNKCLFSRYFLSPIKQFGYLFSLLFFPCGCSLLFILLLTVFVLSAFENLIFINIFYEIWFRWNYQHFWSFFDLMWDFKQILSQNWDEKCAHNMWTK